MIINSESSQFQEIHVWADDSPSNDLGFLSAYTKTLREGDSILDIGCGQGKLVAAIAKTGYPVIGVDSNSESIAFALSQGLPVEQIGAEEAIQKYLDNYTVFSMLDFIEHISLESLSSILAAVATKPGAKLWIQTPNLESLMGLKFWFHVPSHVLPLNPLVLRRLLDRYQFEISHEWTDYGGIPWTGLRRWIVLKLLNAIFGPPLAAMFLGGGNICLIAQVKTSVS